jgi:hypothetical protein
MTNQEDITQLVESITKDKHYTEFKDQIPDMVDDIIEIVTNSATSRLYQLQQGIKEAEIEAAIYGIESIRTKMEKLNSPTASEFIDLISQ